MRSEFWQRITYARRENADIPNIPRELNPYERFYLRFAFAGAKMLAAFLAGVVLAALYVGFTVNVYVFLTVLATVLVFGWKIQGPWGK